VMAECFQCLDCTAFTKSSSRCLLPS
jgi:hypothetical protein